MNASRKAAQFDAILRDVCAQYRLARSDYIEAHEDLATGYIKLMFKAPAYSPELIVMANQLHHALNDEFRGEVVRAAVPEFSTQAAALADAILNPKPRIISFDPAVYNYKF